MGDGLTSNLECSTIHALLRLTTTKQTGETAEEREARVVDMIDNQPNVTSFLTRYRRDREASATGMWGFKHPSLDLIMHSVLDVFPDAIYVVCMRKYERVIESRIKKVGTTDRAMVEAAMGKRIDSAMRIINNPSRLAIPYGRNQRESIARVGKTLGLELTAERWKADR
jgi:hypothetical protein